MQHKRWVLRLAGVEPPRYVADYRATPGDILTDDLARAEGFVRAIDATEMARRLEHYQGVPIEAVAVGGEPVRDTCTTLGCGEPVPEGVHHCERHSVADIGRFLTNWQIDEAARYAARDKLCEELMCADLDGEDIDDADAVLIKALLLRPADLERLRRRP